MKRQFLKHPVTFYLAICVAACSSSSGGSGCTGLQPLPTRYSGPKNDNALNLRLSPQGVAQLNVQWQTLLSQFYPGGQIDVPLSCMPTNAPVIGNFKFADQGDANNNGRLDDKCDAKDLPANISVKINSFELSTSPTNEIVAELDATVNTPPIYMTKGPIHCQVELDSDRAQPGTNGFAARIKLSIDSKWDKLLKFEFSALDGEGVCGDTGSSPPPNCIDSNDFRFDSACFGFDPICSAASIECKAANWGWVKNILVKQLGDTISKKIQEGLSSQTCEPCSDTKTPACPQLAGASSTCINKKCIDTATNQCVPRFLGVEGRLGIGSLLAQYGAPDDSAIDLSLAAGSSFNVNAGINTGMRAGVKATMQAPCVPFVDAPMMPVVEAPNFDSQSPVGNKYDLGIGVSNAFLTQAFHHAHQAGVLCLAMDSSALGGLTTNSISLAIPQLAPLTVVDGLGAPMMVVLKPKTAPVVTIGEGVINPQTSAIEKPLFTLALNQLEIDVYGLIDDRQVRMFTVAVDAKVPMALFVDGCSGIKPVLSENGFEISRFAIKNSEFITETVQMSLSTALSSLLQSALKPLVSRIATQFQLPDVGPFKLGVVGIKGLSPVQGTEQYQHIGIFARLLDKSASCMTP